ncbi:hypothetical protein GQ42DRAFT_85711 [Ramicandelaber brevisporus]|nr:hypothetical protein GQ42DRAFT_85711 [Ramicandelaber brevisporus]
MRIDDEQPDELEQQQQQPTLPLLYLPIELAEEISSYFESWTAAKLLRVNRSFHSLFLPRVWVRLNGLTVLKGDEARRSMLEKYGHFIRSISLSSYTMSELKFNWQPFVKRATHLNATIDNRFTANGVEMLMKLIKQSKMLRTLSLHFDKYDTPVMFSELAAAINELEYLERITCEFGKIFDTNEDGSDWKRAVSFVDLLHPTKRSKLRLKMKFSRVPNETGVRALAPYIVKLKAYGRRVCTVQLADVFFDVMDDNGQQLVFPHLKELSMKSCCFSREYSGLKSITASRFPQLQFLYFYADPCAVLGRVDPNRNVHETYNWKPEYSGYPHISIPSHRWQYLTNLIIGIVSSSILMDIIGFNPRLQQLRVGSIYSNVPKENDASKYNHDEFHLDTILYRLPRLVDFWIELLNSRIIVDPVAIPVPRRYEMKITIGCQMSVAPSAAVYILQMPQLQILTFYECVFVDIDKIIRLLQSSSTASGVKWFTWNPIVWHQELALTMTNKMPQLVRFMAQKCPEEHRAIFEAKCQSNR